MIMPTLTRYGLGSVLRGGVLALALIAAVGCGPLQYTANMIAAQSALEAARDGNARWLAAYEFYSAQAHLEKAREEAAEGEYEDAIRFADVATSYAQRALELAMRKEKEDK